MTILYPVQITVFWEENIVHFSAEFKELFWKESLKAMLPKDIVRSLGIDPIMLGDTRISGIKSVIANEVKKR